MDSLTEGQSPSAHQTAEPLSDDVGVAFRRKREPAGAGVSIKPGVERSGTPGTLFAKFRPFDGRTGKGWQEVGVIPDLNVPAQQALPVAHWQAVKNLAAKANGPRRQQLSWLATLLELEVNGPKQVPVAVLETYTGKYDGGKIIVTLKEGQLYFLGASGVTRKLIALGDDTFLIEDSSVPAEHQARVRFVKNAAGVVTELQLMIADGRAFPRARVQ